MALIWWWLALLGLVACAVTGWRWWRSRKGDHVDGVRLSNTQRIRSSARYAALVRRAFTWSTVQLLSLVLMGLGSLLLMGRLAVGNVNDAEFHNRDIMLCLDVSGSMQEIDAALLAEFATIAEGLQGERIGLVIWDSTSIMKFPLTTDYRFIAEQLDEGAKLMYERAYDWTTGTSAVSGSSLIGDGLVSCLDRFDRLEEDRSRTVILATDNEVSGEPLWPLTEAFDLAVERKVGVYGLAKFETDKVNELRREATRTGGTVHIMVDPSAAGQIIGAIDNQEATRFRGSPQRQLSDTPWPATLLIGLGLVALVVSSDRLRPGARPPRNNRGQQGGQR